VVLICSAVLCLLMLLFPPFIEHLPNTMTNNLGYGFIFSPPSGNRTGEVNVALLLAQWIALAICTGTAYWLFRGQGSSSESTGTSPQPTDSRQITQSPTESTNTAWNAELVNIHSDANGVYAIALAEIMGNRKQAELWARCVVEADGDKEKATAHYIGLRVQQLSLDSAPPITSADIGDCVASVLAAEPNSEDINSAPKGHKLLLWSVVGIVAIVSVGTLTLKPKTIQSDPVNVSTVAVPSLPPADMKPALNQEAAPVFHKFDKPFTVKLADKDPEAYMQTEIQLRLSPNSSLVTVNQFDPEMKHRIMLILLAKSVSDLNTPQGMQKLSNEIRDRLNAVLGTSNPQFPNTPIQAVLFTSLIIQ
jgi:flagellar FliL protein